MNTVSTSVRRPGSFPGGSAVDVMSQVSDTSTLGVNMAEYVLGSSPHNARLHNVNHRYVSTHTHAEHILRTSSSSSSISRTYRLTWHKLNTIASRTQYTNYKDKN